MRVLLIVCSCFIAYVSASDTPAIDRPTMKLNTSNQGKFAEFSRLFAAQGYDLEMTHVDLKEVDADPVTVVAQKASQVPEGVIVEDTSLEIEGACVGVNVRWLMDHLSDYAGKKAVWTVLLAYRTGDRILVFQGVVKGVIVKSQGSGGFGFDPVFLPEGATETLAQSKPDRYNARFMAVEALIKKDVLTERLPIEHWDGPWQHD